MDLPEDLHHLIEQLGAAVMAAISDDVRCRALAQAIQAYGWDVGLGVEATISLHRHEDSEDPEASDPKPPKAPSPWSDADRDILRTFRIRLD